MVTCLFAHQNHEALDEIAQLLNIARPTVFPERFQYLRLEFFHRPVMTFGHLSVEMFD